MNPSSTASIPGTHPANDDRLALVSWAIVRVLLAAGLHSAASLAMSNHRWQLVRLDLAARAMLVEHGRGRQELEAAAEVAELFEDGTDRRTLDRAVVLLADAAHQTSVAWLADARIAYAARGAVGGAL